MEHNMINIVMGRGEEVGVSFNVVMGDMCENEEVKKVGEELREVMKAVFQMNNDKPRMGELQERWKKVCDKVSCLREVRHDIECRQGKGEDCGVPQIQRGRTRTRERRSGS